MKPLCTRPGCDDPFCTREHEYICEHCSGPCEELFEVRDEDLTVGYRNTIEVCHTCLTQHPPRRSN